MANLYQKAKKAYSTFLFLKTKTKRKLKSVIIKQSPIWDDWTQIEDVTPPGLKNAYVFLPIAPGDYYLLAMPPGPKINYPKNLSKKIKRRFPN